MHKFNTIGSKISDVAHSKIAQSVLNVAGLVPVLSTGVNVVRAGIDMGDQLLTQTKTAEQLMNTGAGLAHDIKGGNFDVNKAKKLVQDTGEFGRGVHQSIQKMNKMKQ